MFDENGKLISDWKPQRIFNLKIKIMRAIHKAMHRIALKIAYKILDYLFAKGYYDYWVRYIKI